jgi:hypothetical protein
VVVSSGPGTSGTTESADLFGRPKEWAAALDGLATRLFRDRPAPRRNEWTAETPAPPVRSGWLKPWMVAAGAGALAGAVAIPFGLSNRANRDALTSTPHLQSEIDRLNSLQQTQGIIADGLFAAAFIGGCTAIWLALCED